MKLSEEARRMFAAEIERAVARGMSHFAKPVGFPGMRFAKSEGPKAVPHE